MSEPMDIDTGRRLLQEATEGQWETSVHMGDDGYEAAISVLIPYSGRVYVAVADNDDAELIVWLRNNATTLLDAYEKPTSGYGNCTAATPKARGRDSAPSATTPGPVQPSAL